MHHFQKYDYLKNCPDMPTQPTVEDVVLYYLATRRPDVKITTWYNYCAQSLPYIVGPLPTGGKQIRFQYARTKLCPVGQELLNMLGSEKLCELTTARIRQWHRLVSDTVSASTARAAKKHLRAALMLAAEDFSVSVPPMPAHRGKGTPRTKKAILAPTQVGRILRAALSGDPRGIYYAFPFLTGVRPSEQLALLWKDVDVANRKIKIRRMQQIDGIICEFTKTAAGMRDVPIGPLLHELLTKWEGTCPRGNEAERLVFPNLASRRCKTHPKRGKSLSYVNFRTSYWQPIFRKLGLPYVTPHSARHSFISTLQASGAEVGLVAQLAGHSDPGLTLSIYTQAVRDGSNAVAALESTYVGVRD
jgi:integrase